MRFQIQRMSSTEGMTTPEYPPAPSAVWLAALNDTQRGCWVIELADFVDLLNLKRDAGHDLLFGATLDTVPGAATCFGRITICDGSVT